jgi:hypothetical protein
LTLATEKKQEKYPKKRTSKQYRSHFRTFLKESNAYYVISVINAAKNDDVMAYEALWKIH